MEVEQNCLVHWEAEPCDLSCVSSAWSLAAKDSNPASIASAFAMSDSREVARGRGRASVVDGAPVFGRRSVEFSVGINVLTSIHAKFLGKTYHFG